MQSIERKERQMRGITLLELLIVMVILMMVTAAAIPMVAPAMRNRQMREATRLVSAYFGAARARAVQTGRPVGIIIERFNGNPFALQMSQVQVPPPYSGDTTNSVATTIGAGTPSATTTARVPTGMTATWLKATMGADFNPKLVRVGDTIKFGNQGLTYTILGPDETPAADGIVDGLALDVCYLSNGPIAGKIFIPWLNAAPVPQPPTYQVFRQPSRSTAQPLILPEGIVVDLSVSGIGSERFNITDYSANIGGTVPAPSVTVDPIVIFSPSGRLEYVTNRFGQFVRPLASVNLLLGRRELMFDVTTKGNSKDIVFQNLGPISTPNGGTLMPPTENFWMTIGYQTGQISVSQIAPNYQNYDGTSIGGVTPPTNLQGVIDFTLYGNGSVAYPGALGFAKESQSLGGR